MLRVHRVSLGLAVVAAAPAAAQLNDLDEALRTTPITTQQLAENFHVLFGVGGNILVSIGENGVLIVDDQFPQMVPKYKATIGELGGGAIDFAINTHWHFDHADGNQVLGSQGTWLVAHENSRQMLTKANVVNLVSQRRDQPAYAETALPVVTYDDKMRFHFNGERIDLVHFGVLCVVNIMIGLVTPPYGLLLFMMNRIANVPLRDMVREVLPFLAVMIVALALITLVPDFVLFLPRLLGYKG